MNTPRCSFVIPAYNMERWISKAIYSARNQKEKKIEIIVVNDGSTDDTGAIIDWHAKEDKRIVALHLPRNSGRSAARNKGNDLATSDIILVLDADDMATRDRTKDTIAAFQLKKCDLLYGSFHVIDGLGNVAGKVPAMAFDPEVCKAKKLNYICHSTMAYTKKLAMDIKYESGHWAQLGLDDWKFQWDAYRKGYSLKHIRNPLCYYRDTPDNITATRDPKAVEAAKVAYLA